MRTCSFRLQIARAAAMAVALMICSSGRTDEPTDFYQGKNITLYLGYPPGGAYDFVCPQSPVAGRARADPDPARHGPAAAAAASIARTVAALCQAFERTRTWSSWPRLTGWRSKSTL